MIKFFFRFSLVSFISLIWLNSLKSQPPNCRAIDSLITIYSTYRPQPSTYNPQPDSICTIEDIYYFPQYVPDILKKVFPLGQFCYNERYSDCNTTTGMGSAIMMYYFDNYYYDPFRSFNEIVSKTNYENEITIKDKALAILTMRAFFNSCDSVSVRINSELISTEIQRNPWVTFNYKLEYQINEKKDSLFFMTERNAIVAFGFRANAWDSIKYSIYSLDEPIFK